MTILPSIDIFEKYISNIRDKAFSDINAIFFNENIDFLLTSNYLDFLEMHFGENEIIRALIVELSDTNRSSPNPIDNLEDSIYETLYLDNCDNIDCLFAITFNDKLNIEHYRYTEQNKIDKNKEFLLFELLNKNIISLHHYDFKSNIEIQKLIKKTFKLPTELSRISIYNRYSEHKYLSFLKNKSIYYFNYNNKKSFHDRRLEFIRTNADLKNNLGRNLVLKTTFDSKLIHERKIFFNHFVITTDQALDNLLITELNWKMDIEIDKKKCVTEWSKKNRFFNRLN